MWIYTPRHASVAFPLADGRRDRDVADGGSLAHFDGVLCLAEEVLDGGELGGGDCEGLGAEGVADEEAEVWLCVWGLCAGDTKGTMGLPGAAD
jgi:hypothetical protein